MATSKPNREFVFAKRPSTATTIVHKLTRRYGEQAFLEATPRAQQYRRLDAGAIKRILA